MTYGSWLRHQKITKQSRLKSKYVFKAITYADKLKGSKHASRLLAEVWDGSRLLAEVWDGLWWDLLSCCKVGICPCTHCTLRSTRSVVAPSWCKYSISQWSTWGRSVYGTARCLLHLAISTLCVGWKSPLMAWSNLLALKSGPWKSSEKDSIYPNGSWSMCIQRCRRRACFP